MSYNFSPKFIIEQLDKYVVGQERAKQDLAILGFYQSMRQQIEQTEYEAEIENIWEDRFGANNDTPSLIITKDGEDNVTSYGMTEPKYKQINKLKREFSFTAYLSSIECRLPGKHGLIMGPSGCGKTYLVHLLGKILNVPVAYVNAMELTLTGYVGSTIADLVESGLRLAISSGNFDETQIKYAIVFVDEFDKRCVGESVKTWDSQIQYTLLTALEGRTLTDVGKDGTVIVDTSRLLWILGGSFQHLRDKKNSNAKSMGYTASIDPSTDRTVVYSHADLEEGGIIKEVAGRLPVVTEVWELTREQLREALTKENNVLDSYKILYDFLGKDLELTEDQIERVLDKCIESKIGARGLSTALHDILREDLTELSYPIM